MRFFYNRRFVKLKTHEGTALYECACGAVLLESELEEHEETCDVAKEGENDD